MKIYIGTTFHIELPTNGCLVIDDDVRGVPRSRIFDPTVHSFNPLKTLDYRKAADIADTFDALFSRGESTLTKDTGLDCIADALDQKPVSFETLIPEPDKNSPTGQIWAYGKVRRLMRSPVLKKMLCTPTNFSFNPRSTIFARVNRAELGEFDALAIGLFLMAQYKGMLVIPDLGFYGRDAHASLIRENRLMAGVRFLDELPPKLRSTVLLLETTPSGTTHEDAETLAGYAGLIRGTIEYNDFVDGAMRTPERPPQPLGEPPPVKIPKTPPTQLQRPAAAARKRHRRFGKEAAADPY